VRIGKSPKQIFSNGHGPEVISQYLKIARSSKRFHRLIKLAELCDCTWQVLALEAIDSMLDEELPEKMSPR
jgi:hypothetical protein